MKAKPKYQDLKLSLDEVAAKLGDTNVTIDEAIELYKKGQEIIGLMEKYLDQAQNKIDELMSSKGSDS